MSARDDTTSMNRDVPPRPRMQIQIGAATIAMLAAVAVLAPLYISTAAPDLTFWDAPEFMTAAHTLGIPHPPGTPLWTLAGRASAIAFSARGPAFSVTILSIIATVAACALGARLVARWLHGRSAIIAGLAAAVCAGTMTSVWANATETEVYAMSLLLAVAILTAGDMAGQANVSDERRRRARALMAFLVGLVVPLHLSAMVALPAALVLAYHAPRVRSRDVLVWIALAALGFSAVVVLPIRASFQPELNVGNPATLQGLYDVLTRAQYDVAGLWPRRAPLWIQFANFFEWADWQVAFGLRPTIQPSWVRTPITVAWALLAFAGLRYVWGVERRVGRGVAVLLLSATAGVVVWLNLRAGPSFGFGLLPDGASHEARERDYFFALGFWAWGLLAGVGIASAAYRLTQHMQRAVANGVRTALVAFAAIPLVANASVMNRNHEPESLLPRMLARVMLESVPPGGVLVVAGDNDTYPLLYLQQVEDIRSDVTIVTAPLLAADWHRLALVKRGVAPPGDFVTVWRGSSAALQAIGSHAAARHRPLRVSVYLSATERKNIRPAGGWRLEGVVYAPDDALAAGTLELDEVAIARSSAKVPPSFLAPLNDFDGTASMMQRLLKCTTVRSLDDPLLAGSCNGG